MTTLIKIDLKLGEKIREIKEKYAGFKRELDMGILAAMQRNRDKLFDNEGNYNGHKPWKPLKCRDGMILQDTGRLRNSIAPKSSNGSPGTEGISFVDGNRYVIGTDVPYAAVNSYGTSYTTSFKQRMYLSKNKICGMKWPLKITIPSREFHEITEKDKEDLERNIEGRINYYLNKALTT